MIATHYNSSWEDIDRPIIYKGGPKNYLHGSDSLGVQIITQTSMKRTGKRTYYRRLKGEQENDQNTPWRRRERSRRGRRCRRLHIPPLWTTAKTTAGRSSSRLLFCPSSIGPPLCLILGFRISTEYTGPDQTKQSPSHMSCFSAHRRHHFHHLILICDIKIKS